MSIRLIRAPQQGRWLTPVHGGVGATSQTPTAGRVYLTQFEVPAPCLIDGLAYSIGGTSAGNVIGGVVGPVTRTGDTAAAGVVLAQSASTAQGSINTLQVLTWTAVYATAGIYFAALEFSDATATYNRISNVVQASGVAAVYDRGGGFGALTDPTPAVTETASAIPAMRIRVA